ncbi:MAG: nitroreductase [Planctomycetaceae bacterium]|nr:nitroreductase [Planctomycetaceae bacterium]
MSASTPFDTGFDVQQVERLFQDRRTIGAFRPECPPDDLVLWALDQFRWAPNHHKTEPWRVRWLGPETKARLVDLNAKLVAASKGEDAAEKKRQSWNRVPGWLFVTCRRSSDPLQDEEDVAACHCAVQNLLLALWARGVGSKWATGAVIRHPEAFEILGIDPAEERPIGLIWYGFPDVVPGQPRQPIEAFLQRLP